MRPPGSPLELERRLLRVLRLVTRDLRLSPSTSAEAPRFWLLVRIMGPFS
jgi:hypothetical protein